VENRSPARWRAAAWRPVSFAYINADLGAGSLSFCRGNAPTYASDRGDVRHRRNIGLPYASGLQQLASCDSSGAGLAYTSGLRQLASDVSSGGYKVLRHQEMGVEGGGCGGCGLIDRAPGTHCPPHQMEMVGGKGRPDRTRQLGQPELLRPSISRTSLTGSVDVPDYPASRNGQGVAETSRNCSAGTSRDGEQR
jgi:hypothetical protein